jgi:hypothetical protein
MEVVLLALCERVDLLDGGEATCPAFLALAHTAPPAPCSTPTPTPTPLYTHPLLLQILKQLDVVQPSQLRSPHVAGSTGSG